jgi:hypothetical protein
MSFQQGARVIDIRKRGSKGSGVIVGSTGTGRQRKWLVDFDNGFKNCEVSQRALNLIPPNGDFFVAVSCSFLQ